MLINSILNRVHSHSGFVYKAARRREQQSRTVLDIEIQPRRGSRPVCSGCGRKGSGYDLLPARRFEFAPSGESRTSSSMPRRVDCPRCGVMVERVPWAEGKNHLTTTYVWFLARWAKRLAWEEVAEAFQTSWDNVFRSVTMAVFWGLAHRYLENVTAIGIDEIA